MKNRTIYFITIVNKVTISTDSFTMKHDKFSQMHLEMQIISLKACFTGQSLSERLSHIVSQFFNRALNSTYSTNTYKWLFYLFIFGCVGSSLLRVGFLQLWQAGATLHCSAQASHCGGFSCCRARALGVQASVVAARGLSSCGSWAPEHRLRSGGAQIQLLRSMWDLPRPRLEPVSPALAGGFLTTAPARKSHGFFIKRR